MSGTPNKSRHIVVLGAGAFGGWTALYLRRAGYRVTLLDPWGPGHSRASSSGETRIIRANHGRDVRYVEMGVRAMRLWREHEERWKTPLFNRCGFLWMQAKDEPGEGDSLEPMRDLGVRHEEHDARSAARRFPQIDFADVRYAIFEPDAGCLMARASCALVAQAVANESGEVRLESARPGVISRGAMTSVTLGDGSELKADEFVFACGSWLGSIFPELLGNLIRPTRQEVFFFGTPAGDARYLAPQTPAWLVNGERMWYGIAGIEGRGFKIAEHELGEATDPTTQDRLASREGAESARRYMETRFPGMKGAPLIETRVCQYENSPDSNFIIDRHPDAENVWIAGGGSGHGFKHGPVIGEMMGELVAGRREVDPPFALGRFSARRA